jgi:two-component system chemotaxis response regulator CheY
MNISERNSGDGSGTDPGRKCVLLVDDSMAVRQLLRIMLGTHLTLDIYEAGDGVEAISKLMEKDFDLVITDIRMPQMDGLSLIKKVRGEISVDVPIIVVSTLGKEADRDEGLKLGANSYVTKPVQAPDLIREVTSLLS